MSSMFSLEEVIVRAQIGSQTVMVPVLKHAVRCLVVKGLV